MTERMSWQERTQTAQDWDQEVWCDKAWEQVAAVLAEHEREAKQLAKYRTGPRNESGTGSHART